MSFSSALNTEVGAFLVPYFLRRLCTLSVAPDPVCQDQNGVWIRDISDYKLEKGAISAMDEKHFSRGWWQAWVVLVVLYLFLSRANLRTMGR